MTRIPHSKARRRPGYAIPAMLSAVIVLCLCAGESAAQRQPATVLPDEIVQLLAADPLSRPVVDPRRRFLLLVHARQLVPLDRLAAPVVSVLGRKVNPQTGAAYAPLEYYGLTLIDLTTGAQHRLKLPADGLIGFPQWAPDGSRFTFTLTRSTGATELWVGEPVFATVRLLQNFVSASRGQPCAWTPDSRRMLCRRAVTRPSKSRYVTVDTDIASDLLASQFLARSPVPLSDQAARQLLESQLELIDTDTGGVLRIGTQAAVESAEAAPAGAFLLIERILEPYPDLSGARDVARATEVRDRFGNLVLTLPSGARAVAWHPAEPATLVWVERRDGIDRVVRLAPPFSGRPLERFALPHRFSGLRWVGDTSRALVSDFDPEARRTSLWLVDFGRDVTESEEVASDSSEAALTPVMGFNERGMRTAVEYAGAVYLKGTEIHDGEERPYLDRLTLSDHSRERLWAGDSQRFERVIDILDPAAGRLLIRRESAVAPPYYLVVDRTTMGEWGLTESDRPASLLADARRIPLRYARADGLDLGATLYVPAGVEPGAALPLIVWAYPGRSAPGQDATGAYDARRFPSFERAFRLYFLLRGFAVLDDVSMPIVGSATDANDTFTTQIIDNARAAIEAAGLTGYVNTSRAGIAGHSYGAFMVANLLAHSDLFRAGVALSGAYNRTLTPFGFQTERRTLWEAPEMYLSLSPLLYADRIEEPLLLVHGLMDDNAGTAPIQSIQFYEAIRGNGGRTELLLLPWEGHEYRARESVLKTAGQMLEWFESTLMESEDETGQEKTGASLRPL